MITPSTSLVKALNQKPTVSKQRRKRRVDQLSFVKAVSVPSSWQNLSPTPALVRKGALLVTGLGVLAFAHHMIPTAAIGQKFITIAGNSPYTPLIFTIGATILPVFILPHALFPVIGGVLLTPVVALTLSVIAETGATLITYGIGKQIGEHSRLGRRIKEDSAQYTGLLKTYPFETSTFLQLVHMPMFGYMAGMFEIGWWPVVAGTVIGGLPPTIFLVEVGRAVASGLTSSVVTFNPLPLLLSGSAVVASVLVAKNRTKQLSPVLDNAPTQLLPQRS